MQKIALPLQDDELELLIDGDSDTVMVFVHGLTGHPDEHIFYNAARFFPQHVYTTCRFSLYTDNYPLTVQGLADHSDRLDAVIDYCTQHFSKLVLVGHSLGGPTILSAQFHKADCMVLRDATLSGSWIDEDFAPYEGETYITNRPVQSLVSQKLYDDVRQFDIAVLDELDIPCKVICAEEGLLKAPWAEHIDRIPADHTLVVIPGADHCFNNENNEEMLFQETLQWVEKYIT